MNVPGSNLLRQALGLIGSQRVVYYKSLTRVRNPQGYWVGSFDVPAIVDIGSVQAVPRTTYAVLGLDLQKEYVNWFVPKVVADLERDITGDQMEYGPSKYQLVSATDWASQDGWKQVLCVRVGPINA